MTRILVLVAFFIFTAIAEAGDWPQWLGPNRDGVSAEKIAPWKAAPKQVWSVAVGEGHSSPVVVGGRVFLHTHVADKNEEELRAFDAATGKLEWATAYPRAPFGSPFGNGPRATPAVVDGQVYTFGVTGILSCFNAQTGKKVWQVDTLTKFKAPNLTFGTSCSPIVEGDKVLVNVGKGASVVAFDKDKGSVAWTSLEDPASYSSPISFGKGKDRQVVFLTSQGVVALSPGDGQVFWKIPLVDKLSESSTTPVKIGNLLFASSVTFGGVGLKLLEKEGKPTAEQAWKNPELSCYFSTPIPVGADHIYMVTGSISLVPQATLRCVDAKTGKEFWHQDKIGKYHASLLRTGDDKLLLLDDAGSLALLEPGTKEYRELCRSPVCGLTWSHPAFAGGKLYLRDDKKLICLQLGE